MARQTKAAVTRGATVPTARKSRSNLVEHASAVHTARPHAEGFIDVDALARDLGLTKAALAQTLGFAEVTLQRVARAHAAKTQQRLREFLDIIDRVEPWTGGRMQAFGWYRGQGIPALGDQTAEALVKHDEAPLVRAYLDAFAAGGYA